MSHPLVHAIASVPSIAYLPCQIRHVRWTLSSQPCPRCGCPARRAWDVVRTAIDLDLEQPALLAITVSVHHCRTCRHRFRAQPPFLRRDALYTNRVVAKAIQAVFEDGLAFRRVPNRLARDFGIQPSEAMVRTWCRVYGMHVDEQDTYLPWVVESFSGVLCVDEVYEGELAMLLAVDPAGPAGDRLVGYQLVRGTVDAAAVTAFLTRLKTAGVLPEQVISDGSSLYPAVLAAVWPAAAHQLCLFHETRHVTDAVLAVVTQARQMLPVPPPRPRQGRGGPLTPEPPTSHPCDPATQQWHLRRAHRHKDIAEVHALARQGYSQRAIAAQTGRHRRTVRAWLREAIPTLTTESAAIAAQVAGDALPLRRRRRTPERQARVRALAQQGLSHSAIARITGLHRVTVSLWLKTAAHAEPSRETTDLAIDGDVASKELLPDLDTPGEQALPAPWRTWEEVREVREALRAHRWLLLRRPEHLSEEHAAQVASLVAGPVGHLVGVARRFLLDWYALWHTPEGQRRSVAEARERYEAWHTDPAYLALPALRKVLAQVTPTRFTHLSQFLRHAHWEATNNGAERAGRLFRHRQAPHFRLRSDAAITGAFRVVAWQAKERATRQPEPLQRLCRRGRSPRAMPLAHRAA